MSGPGRRNEGAWLWRLALLGLAVLAVAVVLSQRSDARERVCREDWALERLRAIVRIEQEHRTREGRFGWLDELRGSDSLAPGPRGASTWAIDGYRLDVLLPTGRNTVGEVTLGERDGAQADPVLAARHVAVVARPLRPGVDGLRSFYGDEKGTIYVLEGVADAPGLLANALPRTRITQPGDLRSAGPAWRLLDHLEQNP